MDVITPPPPPPIPPKPPHRVQRQVQVEAGMCRKVERWPKHCKHRCERRHRQENTEKKRCETDSRAGFWTVQPAVCGIFLLKHTANTDEHRNLKINFGRGKCQDSSFSTCQPGNRHTPCGGRRTCCQQQQQQQLQQQQLLLLLLLLLLRRRRRLIHQLVQLPVPAPPLDGLYYSCLVD